MISWKPRTCKPYTATVMNIYALVTQYAKASDVIKTRMAQLIKNRLCYLQNNIH